MQEEIARKELHSQSCQSLKGLSGSNFLKEKTEYTLINFMKAVVDNQLKLPVWRKIPLF